MKELTGMNWTGGAMKKKTAKKSVKQTAKTAKKSVKKTAKTAKKSVKQMAKTAKKPMKQTARQSKAGAVPVFAMLAAKGMVAKGMAAKGAFASKSLLGKGMAVNNFHNSSKRFFGGDEWSCSSCKLIPTPETSSMPSTTPVISKTILQPVGQDNTSVVQQMTEDLAVNIPTSDENVIMAGGRTVSSLKSAYMKRLNKMTVVELQKMASARSIKTTKKIDGRTVSVKKATLVRKICDQKHGK